MRLLLLCITVCVGLASASSWAGSFPDRYDRQIKAAVERYWGDYPDWLSWKAQLYQESRLNPHAVSPVGAAGLAQFMPGTWAQVQRELRLPPRSSPHQDIALEAGAYYMAKLRAQWKTERPVFEKNRLAQASYNAGLGNILAAQRLCGGLMWDDFSPCLSRVTGRHATETVGYVDQIARWRKLMEAEK